MEDRRLRPRAETIAERLFDSLTRWSGAIPGRELLREECLENARCWQIEGIFRGSNYLKESPVLSHGRFRMRDRTRNSVTHLYDWWVPLDYADCREISSVFYGHEIEPILVERGVRGGLASVKESFGLRFVEPGDAKDLELAEDDKVLEVWREYRDEEGQVILVGRELLTVDQTTGHTKSLRGVEREGRTEW